MKVWKGSGTQVRSTSVCLTKVRLNKIYNKKSKLNKIQPYLSKLLIYKSINKESMPFKSLVLATRHKPKLTAE